MDDKIKKASEVIKSAKHITAFTGAGISVESGIPPFRGKDGLWNKYDPDCLDIDRYFAKPEKSWLIIKEIFYDFFGKAKPNAAHHFLAKLELNGMLKAVITQNIDNLHQAAGSKIVYEFHGTAERLACTQCSFKISTPKMRLTNTPPYCPDCKGLMKPDFIFFGEGIPNEAYNKSFEESKLADVFIIIGTTGEVMPACMVPQYASKNGAFIIEINPETSLFTNSITNLFLQGKAGEISLLLDKEIFND